MKFESMTLLRKRFFDGYVNLFLKLKQEASGFPEGFETDQQKMDYIADYAKKRGDIFRL